MTGIDKTLVYYLAGPMSYCPQFNVPLFDFVSKQLRELNYQIVSPAELDSAKMRAWALASPDGNPANVKQETGETWGDVLARDVKMISDQVGGIIFLPDWYKSRGAKLEAFVGLLTGKKFATWTEVGLYAATRLYVQNALKDFMP